MAELRNARWGRVGSRCTNTTSPPPARPMVPMATTAKRTLPEDESEAFASPVVHREHAFRAKLARFGYVAWRSLCGVIEVRSALRMTATSMIS